MGNAWSGGSRDPVLNTLDSVGIRSVVVSKREMQEGLLRAYAERYGGWDASRPASAKVSDDWLHITVEYGLVPSEREISVGKKTVATSWVDSGKSLNRADASWLGSKRVPPKCHGMRMSPGMEFNPDSSTLGRFTCATCGTTAGVGWREG